MGGVRDGQLTPLGPFTGIDNVHAEHEAPASSLRKAENVDITDAGRVRRREGYTLKHALVGAHSAWADARLGFGLVAAGTTLYRFTDTREPQAVANVAPLASIAYASVNSSAVFSDGFEMRAISAAGDASPVWIETPGRQPDPVAIVDGPWPAGRYQTAITYIDRDGRESAATESAYITLMVPSQVSLENIPTPSDPFASINVYMTEPNGTTLYYRASRPAGMSSSTVPFGPPGRALETQFLAPMPAGSHLAASNGRLYSAVKSVLWYSEPLRHGLTKPARNFVQFSGLVDGLAATGEAGRGSGVYVSVGGMIRWLDGANPGEFQSMQVYAHGAVPGTMIRVPASYFNIEGLQDTQMLAHWVATNGVLCLGLPGGTVMPYSERTVLADGSEGAAAYIEREGVRQVINNLFGEPTNAVRAKDQFSVRVYRNGVEV